MTLIGSLLVQIFNIKSICKLKLSGVGRLRHNLYLKEIDLLNRRKKSKHEKSSFNNQKLTTIKCKQPSKCLTPQQVPMNNVKTLPCSVEPAAAALKLNSRQQHKSRNLRDCRYTGKTFLLRKGFPGKFSLVSSISMMKIYVHYSSSKDFGLTRGPPLKHGVNHAP